MSFHGVFLGLCEVVKMNRSINYSGFVDLIRDIDPSEPPSPSIRGTTAKVFGEQHREHDCALDDEDLTNTPG